jgi:hypothetical protein
MHSNNMQKYSDHILKTIERTCAEFDLQALTTAYDDCARLGRALRCFSRRVLRLNASQYGGAFAPLVFMPST